MMWRTHLAGGIALSMAALLILQPSLGREAFGVAVVCGALGGLLPDLDAADSKLRWFAPLSSTGKGWSIRPFDLPATVIHATLGHRGAFHSLVALSAVSAAAAMLAWAWGIPADLAVPGIVALALGFLSHLLLDACTPHGIPFLLPFQRRRYHVLPRRFRVVTGSGDEDIALALLATLCLALFLPRLAV